MAYGNNDKTPDYIVSAGVRGEAKKSYVRVGIAYRATNGKNHITVKLHTRPWESWDGTLYLNENTNRQPGDDSDAAF